MNASPQPKLKPATRIAVAKLIRLLGNNAPDGEQRAALAAIRRVLTAAGNTLHDLADHIEAAPALQLPDEPDDDLPPWRVMVAICAERGRKLSSRDRAFLSSSQRRREPPSEKQLDWLQDIFARVAA